MHLFIFGILINALDINTFTNRRRTSDKDTIHKINFSTGVKLSYLSILPYFKY